MSIYPQRFDSWMQWLTDERLFQWNFLRERAGAEAITREIGARVLCNLSKQRKWQELDEIKARIAE